MKTKFTIYTLLLTGLLLIICLSCKKKDAIKTLPVVTITGVANITANAASSGGDITNDGGATVTVRGVCWSTNQTPTTSDQKTSNGTGIGSFISSVAELTPGTTYYIMAYATNAVGTAYSSQSTFTTLALAPVLTTTEISAVTSTSANSGGNISNDGGSPITIRGVCWSTSQNPTIASSKTSDGTGTGSFTSSITGLASGLTYYIRAYATNGIGTAYGNQTTLATTALLPTIGTTSASAITSTTATSGGNITNDGGSAITVRGVCWSTSQSPTTASSKTADGTGTGNFTSSITELTSGSTYYVRAYATNSIGTAYGNQTTLATTVLLPEITTTSVSAITSTTATSGGNITNDGGSAITVRGVCWSTSQNPTTASSKTSDGTGTGSFLSSIMGLDPGATYYLRAYATNSIGTAYGNQITLATTALLPAITTTSASAITSTTATSGGNITSDGGSAVTVRGVCWSTSQNPTTAGSKTSDGTGTGSFASSITGLASGSTYYIRAYATNIAGTAYGMQVNFTSTAEGTGNTVTDIDGNVYHTVTIGTQVWMVENLKTTKYRNGDPLPNITDNVAWSQLNSGAYCNYKNNIDNGNKYGKLYNWYAANDSRQLAPVGWHIPTNNEWKTLSDYVESNFGTSGNIAKALAAKTDWAPSAYYDPIGSIGNDLIKNNSSGFTALPGGVRYGDGSSGFLGVKGVWWGWSKEEYEQNSVWFRYLDYNKSIMSSTEGMYRKACGFSVRCIKD